jgi:mannose-6-phosphate isomerase-like protein (cupin superfamily)
MNASADTLATLDRPAAGAGPADLWWPYGPATGRYTFLVCGNETDGRLAQFVARDSLGAATPLHTHHDADESFLVLAGRLEIVVGDARHEPGPGDFVLGPQGVPHAFRVLSEQAEFLVTYAGAGTPGPAGWGAEGFFREVAPAVREGEDAPAPALPDPELFARRMAVYGIELVGPPPFGP